jgi:4-diphosphocytidyl-2-C-methyl-D-erythritol kinase
VLCLLEKIFTKKTTRNSLSHLRILARGLGSDVPFFVQPEAAGAFSPRAAYVSGRGEIIREIPAPRLFVVLVNAGFYSHTGNAYKLLDEKEKSPKGNGGVAENVLFESPSAWPFFNDFEKVLTRAEYGKMLADLKKEGAAFAGVSGSGSTCFGIFESGVLARECAKKLSALWPFVKIA